MPTVGARRCIPARDGAHGGMSKPYKVRRPPPEKDSRRFYLVTLVVILVAMVTGGVLSRLLY